MKKSYRNPIIYFKTSKHRNVRQKCKYFILKQNSGFHEKYIRYNFFVNSIKLKHFEKFRDTTEALAATTAAVEGKLTKSLKKVSSIL